MRILVVDDEQAVRETLASLLAKLGHGVEQCERAEKALELFAQTPFDIALVDVRLPGMDGLTLLTRLRALQPDASVIMITGYATMETAITALRAGAADFLSKPLNIKELTATIEKSARLGRLNREKRRLRQTVGTLQFPMQTGESKSLLVGASAAISQLRKTIRLAAVGSCPSVLITGETGVGKEVAARELHLCGHSRSDPFIAVSCPALPDTLVESELFGHTKGSFTGATESRSGAFELANGGTLFLDEVSDLSPQAQAKLLRALETRSIKRIGEGIETPIEVMVIAATNHELERMIADGKFRPDLYYRLNTLHIHIPPLRERPEDILPLATHFLAELHVEAGGKDAFSPDVANALSAYDYPGNARELRSIIERASILAGDGKICPEHLLLPQAGSRLANLAATRASVKNQNSSVKQSPTDPEAIETLRILDECKWNRSKAAAALGISYSALRWRMNKHGL